MASEPEVWDVADIVMEILSYLPAKEICRLQCTNKTFRSCSSHRFFSLLQARRRRGCSDGFLSWGLHDRTVDLFLLDERDPPFTGVDKRSLDSLSHAGTSRSARVIGSANGLIVYEQQLDPDSDDYTLCIQNPCRSQACTLLLPHPVGHAPLSRTFQTAGIAMHHDDDDDHDHDHHGPIMICMQCVEEEWESSIRCWVYRRSTGTGRERWGEPWDVACGGRSLNLERPAVMDGVVYLASDCAPYTRKVPYVLAMCVEEGTSWELPVPEELQETATWEGDSRFEVGVWEGDTLWMVHWSRSRSRFSVWELENGGTGEKRWVWVQRWRPLNVRSIGVEVDSDLSMRFFTMADRERLVFWVGDLVYVYRMSGGGSVNVFPGEDERRAVYPYANTLCSF